jgi:hypothetical protein
MSCPATCSRGTRKRWSNSGQRGSVSAVSINRGTFCIIGDANCRRDPVAGHVTYQLLTHDPRVTLGVPIIGCPDYTALTKSRLAANPSSPPPIFPQTLQQLLLRTDPINSPHSSDDPSQNPFWTKKLLVLTGADDDVVPSALGDKFYQGLLVGPQGVKRRIIQDGVGHRCSREMIGRAAEFLWECGMSEEIEGETGTLGKSML